MHEAVLGGHDGRADSDRGLGAEAARDYVMDPEGGKSALWIAPSGETVLIDTANPGERDNTRIKEMFVAAGVSKIDYLISTHYHVDHVGGLQALVKQYPVGAYVDHGPTVEGPVAPNMREQVPGFQAAYAELWKSAKHLRLAVSFP
jgi:competence protein ComEC